MRKILWVSNTLMWLIYIWTMLAQVMAITGLMRYSPSFNLIELILSVSFLTIAMLLYTIFRKHRLISVIAATISLIFCILAAVKLADQFLLPNIVPGTDNTGLTNLDLTFRHLTTIFVWLFMVVGWLISRQLLKDAQAALHTDYTGQFDLSGPSIFADSSQEKEHPQKRSVRTRIKKQQESDFE